MPADRQRRRASDGHARGDAAQLSRDSYQAREGSRPVPRGASRYPSRGPGKGTAAGRKRTVADVRRGSTLNLASSAVSAIATTGVTVLVARQFSPERAGAFFTSTSVFVIISAIASLGTNVGLTYYIARYRSLGEANKIPALMRTAIIPVLVASAVTTALLLAVAGPLARLVVSGHAGNPAVAANVAYALRGLALALPFAALLTANLGASRGYGDMRPTAIISQIGLPAGKVLGVLAASAMGSVALLAPLWAVPYIPAAILGWLWERRIARDRARPLAALYNVPPEVAALLALSKPVPPANRPQWGSRMARRQRASTRRFWSFTTPRAIANVAQNVLQQLDIVLVAAIKGPSAAAVYTAATRFLVVGQLGNTAISRASQARFTELFTLGDRRGANAIYKVTTTWIILLLWPVFLLSVIYGPVVLSVFGRSYTAGDTVMVVLGLSMLLASLCGQVDMVLVTSGRSSWSLVNGLLTVGVNVALDLVLIPRYGITGAAIGWGAAIAVSNLMPLAQLAGILRLHPFGRSTVLACVLCAVSFGAIPLAVRTALGDGPVSLAAAVAASCTVQLVGLWRFRHVLHLPALPRRLSRSGARGAAIR